MKNLQALLERLTKTLNKDESIKGAIVQAIASKTGITLQGEAIMLKEGVLTITGSPAVKNEIRLKEEIIGIELKEIYQIVVTRFLYK